MIDFQKYFSERIVDVRDMNNKGNNRLFEIKLNRGSLLLKVYSTQHMDNWQRGKVEFSALSCLWRKGFREIPQPILFHEKDSVAVYSYNSGKTLKANEVNDEQICCAANFLGKLHKLDNEDKSLFAPASAACLSLREYMEVLDRRFRNVSLFAPENPILKRARIFLDGRVYPEIEKLKEDLSAKSPDLNTELSLDCQVLTPADFGFHNILVSPNSYTFVDFEYFGRDDPARQILDFLHHDKSRDIKRDLSSLFLEEYRKRANPKEGFDERLRLVDSLVGMSWVLIYLNPLSKGYREHKRFVLGDDRDLIEERLNKAEDKMNHLRYFER